MVSEPLSADEDRAGHERMGDVPGPERKIIRNYEKYGHPALARCLGRSHRARLALVAEDGWEVFSLRFIEGVACECEKDRNHFRHGNHFSACAGREDQRLEG